MNDGADDEREVSTKLSHISKEARALLFPRHAVGYLTSLWLVGREEDRRLQQLSSFPIQGRVRLT